MPGFRFGAFELDVAAYTLTRAGKRIKLEKVPMEVLILLVDNAGILVERSRIQDSLWGSDVFVERDAAINTAMRKLRQALDDDAETPKFVETIVGKGYRFVAPVESLEPSVTRKKEGASARPSSVRWGRSFPSFCLMRGTQEFVLKTGVNLLGRDPAARVYVDHPSVSRRHARISIEANRVVLDDLNSRNGTFLNGRRIDTPMEIGNGAIIGLGPITLTFIILSAPASTRSLTGAGGADERSERR